ncbi:hypothetical protein F4677DRAFT_429746 [Hypoxylon crocopeplum]|nr:hypothetical protein F4677DRAFT_429746 [Hypoxylon crocopeplum]
MRKQHHLIVRVPIPVDLPPGVLVDALQTHGPLMRHHPLITKFEERSMSNTDMASIRADPFLGSDTDLASFTVYQVYEEVPIVPGLLTTKLDFPAFYQNTDRGIRFRVHTSGGVILWGDIAVVRRDPNVGEGRGGGNLTSAAEPHGDTEWELVEECNVEVSALLLPFVRRSMTRSNENVCRGVIDEVAKTWRASSG